PVLTQPASLSASPGASARLSCTPSSGYSGGAYALYWYERKFYADSSKYQGSGVPSRFSGSKAASANAGLLVTSGLQPRTRLTIYCSAYHRSTDTNKVLQTHEEVR
ncbi:hypothetical protein FD754_023380, partial [Muntiacus muntjak]